MASTVPPSPQGPLNGHVKELDGLRGVAIVLVLIHHFWPKTGYWARFSDVAELGWAGVDLFFVLSGFLITGILLEAVGKPHYYRNFYARRILRIFPLYYLFLAFVFSVIPLFEQGSYWDTALLRHSGSPLWYACFLGNVRESLLGEVPSYVIAPLWSLAMEEQFYVVFPLVVSIAAGRLAAVLGVLVAFAIGFRFVTFCLLPENVNIQYVATFSRMDGIALGCLLAVWYRSGRGIPRRKYTAAALLLMAAAVCICFLTGGLDRNSPFCRIAGFSLTSLASASLVLFVIQNRGTFWTGLFRFNLLCFMGVLCYGIYLLHRPAEVLLSMGLWVLKIDCDQGSMFLFLGKVAAAVLTAFVSWRVIEQRFIRLKCYFVSERPPSIRADAASSRLTPGVLVEMVVSRREEPRGQPQVGGEPQGAGLVGRPGEDFLILR